ncbi:MAG TPA: hypothetical protein DCE41_00820 [Cytophagales bacterium]|nr:hypothetical protein [Cytophagales bacterium]HAA20088.1 hypothetical protein [Cytophagales bacterium]HAP60635.1 hypothetical protein [Cytophagales bacterium]
MEEVMQDEDLILWYRGKDFTYTGGTPSGTYKSKGELIDFIHGDKWITGIQIIVHGPLPISHFNLGLEKVDVGIMIPILPNKFYEGSPDEQFLNIEIPIEARNFKWHVHLPEEIPAGTELKFSSVFRVKTKTRGGE